MGRQRACQGGHATVHSVRASFAVGVDLGMRQSGPGTVNSRFRPQGNSVGHTRGTFSLTGRILPPLSEGQKAPRPTAARVRRQAGQLASWEEVTQLRPNIKLCVYRKNGTDLCGRLEMVQSGRLILRTSESTSTAVTQFEVSEIHRQTKTRRLQQADGYARRVEEHIMIGAEILGPHAGITLLAYPFYVAGAALVGAIKGSPEWTPVYIAP